MKKRRKHKKCLNCGHNLHESHNYCSNCGQENTDNEVGVGLLLREFTSNFFSLDSRFGRTFKPFLLRPGKITNAFNEGKRVLYANPIRWYLVISVFHFFFFTKVVSSNNENEGAFKWSGLDAYEMDSTKFDSLLYLPDSLVDESDWPLPDHYFLLVNHLANDDHSYSKIVDTLKINELNYPWFRSQFAKKSIKLTVDSEATVSQYFIRQIPVLMFFILPVYAFLLKLFFWRRGLYIKHLIHSLHIHSFLFFLMGFVWILAWILWEDAYQDLRNYMILITILITIIYILISFKTVYRTRWIGNILRIFGIGFLYFISLIFAMGIGMIISLFFY